MNRVAALVVTGTVAAGTAIWQRYRAEKAEKELWDEVRDAVD